MCGRRSEETHALKNVDLGGRFGDLASCMFVAQDEVPDEANERDEVVLR